MNPETTIHPETTHRLGKIARLPAAVRQKLNERLEDNEPAPQLLAWLHSLPEVRKVLKQLFEGRPISEQNLSAWKHGGFRDWQRHQQIRARAHEFLEEGRELAEEVAAPGEGGSLLDRVGDRLALSLLELFREAEAGEPGPERTRTMLAIAREVARLRRGDHERQQAEVAEQRWRHERDLTLREVREHEEEKQRAEVATALKTTNIETTMDYEGGQRRHRKKVFSWISEWQMTEENGRIKGIEVVLAEWLFESIQDFNVLTLDKRYFAINGGIERWLYLYARKATGAGVWKESLRSLHKKSAGQQAFKHYASKVRKVVKKNELPGLRLETRLSAKGEQMLLMERTEKLDPIEADAARQLALIESTSLEDAWQNVLELMRKRVGAGEVKAWLECLRLLSLEDGVLAFRPQNKFIGDTVLNAGARSAPMLRSR